MAKLIFTEGDPPKHFALNGEGTSIGRAPDNVLVLDDETVSGHHAEIVHENGTFLLRDLGSSNGTRVNGKSITEAEVIEGDQIKFGGVECFFQNSPTHEALQSIPAVASIPDVKPIQVAGLVLDPELPSSAASVPDAESAARSIPSPQPKELGPSFGSKLASFGRAAFEETKRNAKLAGIKGKIEKLKLVDLNKAHCGLGKKCYDLGLFRDQFEKQFDEIRKLNQRIEENRKGTTAVEGQTTSEALKQGAMEIAMQAKAETLSLKLQPLFISLGREIEASKLTGPGTDAEVMSLKKVRESIASTENEGETIRADASHWVDLKMHSSSAAASLKTILRTLKRELAAFLSKPTIAGFATLAIITIAVIVLATVVVGVVLVFSSNDLTVEKLSTLYPPDISLNLKTNGPWIWNCGPLLINVDAKKGGRITSVYYSAEKLIDLDEKGLLAAHSGTHKWIETLADPLDSAYGPFASERHSWRRDDGRFIGTFIPDGSSSAPALWVRTPEENQRENAELHAIIRGAFPICGFLHGDLKQYIRSLKSLDTKSSEPLGMTFETFKSNFPDLQWQKDAPWAFSKDFANSTAYIGYDSKAIRCYAVATGSRLHFITIESFDGSTAINSNARTLAALANGQPWEKLPAGLAIEHGNIWVRADAGAVAKTESGVGGEDIIVLSAEYWAWLNRQANQ